LLLMLHLSSSSRPSSGAISTRRRFAYLLTLLVVLLGVSPRTVQAQVIAAGGSHSAFIHPDGTLWAWGENRNGELGDGTTIDRVTSVQIGTATTWRSVVAGNTAFDNGYTMAIRTDGTLWAWGSNYYGQLGDGTTTERHSPVQIGTATTWQSVSAGRWHTVAIRTDGTLWAWGRNDLSQLGDGTTTERHSPVQIGTATTWQSVAAAGVGGWDLVTYDYVPVAVTVAVRRDGTLWAWGTNTYSQLGDGTTINRTAPTQIGTATTWQSVSAGAYHVAAVRTDGTLWAWGIGDGTPTGSGVPTQIGTATTWQSVSAGYGHTVALRQDGTLWAWGFNDSGKLGDGTTTSRSLPVQVGTAAIWQSACAGDEHTVALRANGTLWAWGDGGNGQVGSTTLATNNRFSPEQIGTATTWQSVSAYHNYTVALHHDGTLWAWGGNYYGQLGDGTTTNRTVPVQIGTSTMWKSITTSSSYSKSTLAVRTDGTLWAWGNNYSGQLGDGTTTDRATPVQIGTATTWQTVAGGDTYTVALRTDGTLWAWGSNYHSQLGDGTATDRHTPTQIGNATSWQRIAVGGNHAVAIRTDGTLWAWGDNSFGQLGRNQAYTPMQVGTAANWQSVAAGEFYTMAIRTDGTLWSWGYNGSGQLGDGTNNMGREAPTQVGTATNWKSISAGESHVVALRTDGTLWAWGNNYSGQLGDGTFRVAHSVPMQVGAATTWQSASAGSAHTVAIRTDGTLWAWGDNRSGQLGDGLPFSSATPLLIYPLDSQPLAVASSRVSALHLVPNPAHDQVQIPDAGPDAQLRLLDAQGRLVRTGSGTRLTLRGLAPGLYLLQAQTSGRAARTAHLIVE
jgi:alpha-tubulin suppressor-like RCC1 family protein